LGYQFMASGLTDAQQRILALIEELGGASPKQISDTLMPPVGLVMIQRHLKALLSKGCIQKIGAPPRTYYIVTPSGQETSGHSDLVAAIPVAASSRQTLDSYFGFDADFKLYRGEEAFKLWFQQKQVPTLSKQRSSKISFAAQVESNFSILLAAFLELRRTVDQSLDRDLGLIDATARYRSIHHSDVISRVYYQDFYSLPQFGKTLLGHIVQKAKVGEDTSLPYIEEIASILAESLPSLLEKFGCEACAWVPHTIKRRHPLQDLLSKKISLKVKQVAITKVVVGDVVPQKSLSELQQRLQNALLTNHISESPSSMRQLKSVLLIDDAIGSNATIHAIGRKMKTINPELIIYAFAPVGSFKGFDVIRDV